MKISYTIANVPNAVIALAQIRNTNLEDQNGLCQAVESVFGQVFKNIDSAAFSGVKRVAKDTYDIQALLAGRLPSGSVKDWILYCIDVSRAEKKAKKVNGAVTLSDYPAGLAEWTAGFNRVEQKQKKARKHTIKA